MKPSVLFITSAPSPHMSDFIHAVNERGDILWKTLFLLRASPGRHWGCHLPKSNYWFADGSLAKRLQQIKVLLSDRLFDLVVLAYDYYHPESWYVRKLANAAGIPLVFWNEPPNLAVDPLKARFKEVVLRRYLRGCSEIWTTGPKSVERYRAIADCPVRSLSYYIDTTQFLSLPRESERAPGEISLVYAGRLEAIKAPDILVEACKKLSVNWHLDIFGEGSQRCALERAAASFPKEKITFHGGVDYQNRRSMYERADALVVPSHHDGWGVVVLESLAAGVPVIASSAVMAAWEFIDGDNGRIVKAGDPSALASGIESVSKRLSPEMSSAARRAVVNHTPQLGAQLAFEYAGKLLYPPDESARRRTPSPDSYRSGGDLLSVARRGVRNQVVRAVSRIHRPVRPSPGLTVVAYHFVLPHMAKTFAEHLRWFQDCYRLVDLNVGHELVQAGATDPLLAITMDDCFKESVTTSQQYLSQIGGHCTYFISTGQFRLRSSNDWQALRWSRFHLSMGLSPLTPAMTDELRVAGHEIGSHGHEHRSLRRMTVGEAKRDVVESISVLEEITSVRPSTLAYPFGEGREDPDFAQFLTSSGIRLGLTIERGANGPFTNRYKMKRHHIEGDWPLQEIRYFLTRRGHQEPR